MLELTEKHWLMPEQLNWDKILFPRHVHLTRVTFTSMIWMTREVFCALVSPHTCPNLEYLNILDIDNLNNKTTYQYILNSFPKLTSLIIGGKIPPTVFSRLEGGENISELVVKYSIMWEMLDIMWIDFFESFPRIKKN